MTQPRKILVVDDTPGNVKLLTDLLTVKGYDVATAASGHEALARIDADCPDLVLLDIMMPGMNGYEVCQRIRQNPATEILPVVMVTALDPSQERTKGIEAGADDFLGNPVNQQELLPRVRSLFMTLTVAIIKITPKNVIIAPPTAIKTVVIKALSCLNPS